MVCSIDGVMRVLKVDLYAVEECLFSHPELSQ
jgi:hypothetical protein